MAIPQDNVSDMARTRDVRKSATHSQVGVGQVGEVVAAHAVVRVGGQHARVPAARERVHAHAVPAARHAALRAQRHAGQSVPPHYSTHTS